MRQITRASYPAVTRATFFKRLAAAILLTNLFVLVLTGLSLRQSRLLRDERAGIATQNLAQLLDQYIGGSIGKIDVTLLATVDEIEKQIAGGGISKTELNAFLARHSARLPELDGLRMADAQGAIEYGNGVAAGAPTSVADRDYFRRLRDDPQAGLFISRPVVSRVIGEWVVILARRVNRPNGSFAGVVYGVIPLQHFLGLFASVDIGAHGTITLRDGELGIVARYPEPTGVGSTVGQRVVSREFRDLIKRGEKSGTYKARQPVDHIERTFSYRRISSYPLYINVALAADDYLAEWRGEVVKMSAVAALFFLITCFTSWLTWNDWKRRKAVVQSLVQQEAKFRTIADYTYDWEFWLSPDGAFIHSSPSCKRISGYDADSFYADPDLMARIVHPGDRERFSGHRHLAEAAVENDSLVLRIRRSDGTVRWLEHVCQPIVDESGAFFGTRGSNRDITRRIQAEESLRESRDYLDKIINSISDPIFVKDRYHRYLLVNDAECAFIGYSREQLIGRDAYDFFPKEEVEVFWEKDECVFETELENINEEEITTALGEKRVIVTKKSLYKDMGGNKYLVGIIRDITEQKQAEQEMLKAQKLESLGVMAGGIAHDFNNILTGIIGNLSIAKLQLDPSHIIVKRLELCEKAASQATELTRQLVTFARGGEPLKKVIEMAPLIRDTISFALRGSNIRSAIHLKDDLWCLEADGSQLSQVLNNLLLNAVQAMPAGGEITVRADNVTLGPVNPHHLQPGNFLKIAVEDNGCGITREALARVFDPYFTTKPDGTGLGLASVYAIVKKHGGAVEVSSTVGVGTSFTLHLPAIPGRRPEDGWKVEQAGMTGSGRVLVMDDEDFIREVAADILNFIGYEVDSCADGREAVECFRGARDKEVPYSAVILDLTVPGRMGGKEAAARILEIDPGAALIVSSGYSDDPVIANFRQYGFSGVVAKPFDADGLAREMERIIQNKQ